MRPRHGIDWGACAAVGVAVYALAYLIWTCGAWDLGRHTSLLNDLADYPVLAVATVLMVRAARAAPVTRIRRAWRLIAAGFLSLIVANLIYDYLQIVLEQPAFPSLGDLFFLGFFPLMFLGVLSFPERLGTRSEKITFALDAAALMVGGGTLILHFVILPVAGGHTTMEVVLSSYYPLVDVVLVLGLVVILLRNVPVAARRPLHVLAIGCAVLFVADLVYSHDTLANQYVGIRWTDSLWTVSYALAAIAAHLQHRTLASPSRSVDELPERARRRLTSWLPHAAVITTLAVLLVESREHWHDAPGTLVISLTVLFGLVGARQLVAVRENARILAENTTRAGEARFRALVQHSSDVIVVVDRSRVVRYVSPSVERVFGFAVGELDGQPILDLAHPDDLDQVRSFLDGLERDPTTTVTAAWRQRHRSGRWLHVEVVGTNGLGEPTVAGFVLNARDISERVELERERVQARVEQEAHQDQLRHAEKMEAIGRLAGGVAHDMNNALATIVGTADCILEDATSSDLKADAESILLSAKRAAELTRNLLGFARRDEYRNEALRPESLITQVAAMLARSLPKGIRIETSFGDELAAIEGDPTQLSHALVNLCINASDAMNQHGVLTIGAHLARLDADAARTLGLTTGVHLVVSVRDTGSGMDAATRERAFEPFFTTKGPGLGTGLGLAMVYGTVQRHRGAIEVDSAPGLGSTFKIFLPASIKVVPISRATAVRATSPPPNSCAGHILIVDDEPLVRATTQRVLERRGYDVRVAAHGQEGLEVLAEGATFDVVLLDMAMPVMAGPEMFRLARKRYPQLRILLTSGFTSAEDARALLAEGAYGLLEKPFSPSRLFEALSAVLRDQRVDGVAEAAM